MPKVIVPGKSTDRQFDLSDLNRFGDVVYLEMDGAFPDTVDECITALARKLDHVELNNGDTLALVGDPIYMAACAVFMSERIHDLRLLRFDKKHNGYYPVHILL